MSSWRRHRLGLAYLLAVSYLTCAGAKTTKHALGWLTQRYKGMLQSLITDVFDMRYCRSQWL